MTGRVLTFVRVDGHLVRVSTSGWGSVFHSRARAHNASRNAAAIVLCR